MAHVGEYIVGAYLKLKLNCDFVDYNVRPPGGGLEGLQELDVVGLDLGNSTAYLCEATTHIRGVLYRNNEHTVERIKQKHKHQQAYAAKHLRQFNEKHYMFWAPVVPVGYITENLAKVETLELVINGEYKRCVEELRELARADASNCRDGHRAYCVQGRVVEVNMQVHQWHQVGASVIGAATAGVHA